MQMEIIDNYLEITISEIKLAIKDKLQEIRVAIRNIVLQNNNQLHIYTLEAEVFRKVIWVIDALYINPLIF
jgi:hypothetical protein